MTTKQCTKCKEHKPLEAFYNRKGRKDGKESECKACHKARTAARRKERLATDPEYRERRRADARGQQARRFEGGDHWISHYTYRCKKAGVTLVIEPFSRQDVLDRWGDRCTYCKIGEFENLDHYIPIKAGGPHTLANVRPSCAKCNRAKWNSDPLQFAASSSAMDDTEERLDGSN